ncbi:MAG: octaprenyl diphosphate synthase [Candidatus Sedimenticola endophacoides]|uniref:Octaprenyl diphosphate synthase n=2 Tax=Candidatus Sedimenticola endophacoides TaxID=2548426 RepID=A0A657PYM1_9GAMM|nr:MAG: octaprenyl diphosphate synthase [Candidatus Sedimenticola endophacoides]OQX35863.1 MAG: octaprenyl diphosphate synthase [Candidatus Sedimenticola endophacoides]OQX41043.1 MAG: octaprenyl diphosphate synthase [Candidatus Sedimenticola endophacoides]OQX44923.1 MAG: octaprenyl diphosphate synthase [Candidatus Sedimenticola endophacoides]OQX45193.1 MAG: octaprenyl diphosphate synthase [Candidatus Sedimenticola endophacoides]
MDISEIRQLIAEDLAAVDDLILRRLHSDVILINQIGQYIVNSGGKRLRPMIVLLAARALGYQGDKHIELAAVIEFIHTATLLHDDVVDGSELRRNRDTANAVWGNAASVLVGDFLYSRSFEMMVAVDRMRVMQILSTATNRIAEGEVLQLLNCNNPDTTEEQYREVILRKTATLFEAGAQLGAVVNLAPEAQEQALAAYGLHLGIAFQIVDDALDYSACGDEIGKNIGDDLEEGKPTLPLLRAMAVGGAEQQAALREAIEKGGREHIEIVMNAIESTDAIEYTSRLATEEADKAIQALDALPDTPYRHALAAIAEFSVKRSH